MSLDLSRQDAQPSSPQHASYNSANSTSDSRFTKAFRRSSGSFSGGGALARLTSGASSSSSRSQQPDSTDGAKPKKRRPSIGQRLSSRASRKSIDGTGANLAELSKPNGKFKSGIKWDSQQIPEPFMEASDSTAAERELASALQAQSALASRSTAAAQAHAQSRGLGQPIFQNSSSIPPSTTLSPQPTSSMAALSQLPSVSQTISAIANSGVHPEILGTTRSPSMQFEPTPATVAPPAPLAVTKSDFGTTAPIETEIDTRSGDGASPCMTPPVRSRDGSNSEQGVADNHMLARAAQLVLEAARQQARVETRKKGKSAPASPKRSTFSLSPVATTTSSDSNQDNTAIQEPTAAGAESELNRTPSQRARSKSDAGGESQVKRRKSFLRSVSSKARRNRSEAADVPDLPGSETPTPSANSPTSASAATSGTVTPGGRRRRYVDTRDLDLLARELAAEAIAEQVPQPPFARASRSGSSSPHRTKPGFNDPRRRSFPSILEDSPLQDDSITPVHSATNGLKPMTPLHSSNSSRNLSRVKAGDANAKGAAASHSDPTMGLVPKEMFLGLGGSPYPSLPPPSSRSVSANLNGTDPFGIPLTQESSPFDATMAYANKTNVYHTPNQVAVSRSRSNASSVSASPSTSNNKRRPVLTMTMNDPQAELQGLTKPPKESSGKRLTPFGSRASSRAPSPSPSFTNLKKVAAEQKEAQEQNVAQDLGVGNQETGPNVDPQEASAADAQSPDNSLRPEDASVIASRRNSMAPSEMSTRSGLAPPVKAKKMNRLSAIFRSNKSRDHVDTVSSIKPLSNNASLATSPVLSTYATPSAELPSFNISPHSAAVSAGSDADVSPVAFRNIELPSTEDTPRLSKPASATASANASRRSSVALEPAERGTTKKRPVRALLRRLSSFSSSKKKEGKDEKLNFPDASTMPVVDMDKLKQLSEAKDVKADSQDAPIVGQRTSSISASPSMGASQDTTVGGQDGTDVDKGLAPALDGLDLSNASPVPVNEEMAKNGFGTRSAYKLGAGGVNGVNGTERHNEVKQEDAVVPEAKDDLEDSAKEEDVMLAKENIWDRSRPAQIARSDSQTPSSEDSFFMESRPSITSRPGSGALMKHGSESAISEELHTPDPSTAYLPATKEGALEDTTLSSTLSSTVSSATAAAAANGVVKSPVVTALPSEQVQSAAL